MFRFPKYSPNLNIYPSTRHSDHMRESTAVIVASVVDSQNNTISTLSQP